MDGPSPMQVWTFISSLLETMPRVPYQVMSLMMDIQVLKLRNTWTNTNQTSAEEEFTLFFLA